MGVDHLRRSWISYYIPTSLAVYGPEQQVTRCMVSEELERVLQQSARPDLVQYLLRALLELRQVAVHNREEILASLNASDYLVASVAGSIPFIRLDPAVDIALAVEAAQTLVSMSPVWHLISGNPSWSGLPPWRS